MLSDLIETLLTNLCNLSLEGLSESALTKTLSDFNADANNQIISIMKDSVFAIGASLLTLFMLMELCSMITRSSGDNGLGSLKLPANILIKYGVFTLFYCNIPTVLNAIEQIAVELTGKVFTGASTTISVGITSSNITSLVNEIDSLNLMSKLYLSLILVICFLFTHIILAVVNCTVLFRAFEMWILLFLSPIPLATIANTEFRMTAINFLKNYAAIALQGTAIAACFVIYQKLLSGTINGYVSGDAMNFVLNTLIKNLLIYTLCLAVSVFATGRITKSLMNAM
jgi:hypothetical protein